MTEQAHETKAAGYKTYGQGFVNKLLERRLPMMKNFKTFMIALVLVFLCGTAAAVEPPKFANLGDFKLESGKVIKDCKLAYRTLGTMNQKKSNIILMTTWLSGTSQELIDLGFIGDGKMLDTRKYFVIAVDAIGNGVSTSPSNSKDQADTAFPLFTIKDMVNSEYILLTKHLKINHIHAIAGISMGGMQAFQWMVSYPGFMDKAVSIAGTPWMTSYDMLAWTAEVRVIDAAKKNKAGNDEIIKELAPIQTLFVWTPKFRAENTKPEDFAAFMTGVEKDLMKYNMSDWAWQLKAIMTQNILKDFDGSAAKAAKAVKARAMIITSAQDIAVYPGPARAFAVLINAEAPQLTGDCGHFEFLCKQGLLDSLVNGFLGKDDEKKR
jgi:homoserine O-acetyltransferase/O-succinyltransferase